MKASGEFDVVIVGAGPAGAMAAKTAAEIGLRTAVLERKTDPSEITRSCAMMFAIESDYYFGERMFYSDATKKMVFPVNGLSIDYDGPTRDFFAWNFYAPDGVSHLSFGDYDASIGRGKSGRLSFVFDKGQLVRDLLQAAASYGAQIFTGFNLNGLERTATGVRLSANDRIFHAPFVIGADGVNSRTADLAGFNGDRTLFTRGSKQSIVVRGLKMPQPESVNFIGCAIEDADAVCPFWISPCASDGEHMVEFKSDEHLDYFFRRSPFAAWFGSAKIIHRRSYVLSLWSPVNDPVKNHVLLAGDAPWFAEAEITGSMMCGWRAAHSIALAFRDGKLDDEGIRSYSEWWTRTYTQSADYRRFFSMMLFVRSILSAQEINYLYRSIEHPLRATLDPFSVVGLVRDALTPIVPKVREEMPSILQKLELMDTKNLESLANMFSGARTRS